MTPDRTAAAIKARRQNSQQMLQRVQDAIAELRRRKSPVSVAAVSRRAAVSRTFLYENPDARALITDAIHRAHAQRERSQAAQDEQHEAPWRERALNAEDALSLAHKEIQAQRSRIAVLMGQLRDWEQEVPEGAVQRVATENDSLKQRVRQLTQDNRTLEERLSAARSNSRFQDRKIAQLEAQMLEGAFGKP